MTATTEECNARGRSQTQRERGPGLYPVPFVPREVGANIPTMNCDIRWAGIDFHARRLLMPRDGAIIFADLIGKLDVLRVACDKCGAVSQNSI
jgi:hypothetical protein